MPSKVQFNWIQFELSSFFTMCIVSNQKKRQRQKEGVWVWRISHMFWRKTGCAPANGSNVLDLFWHIQWPACWGLGWVFLQQLSDPKLQGQVTNKRKSRSRKQGWSEQGLGSEGTGGNGRQRTNNTEGWTGTQNGGGQRCTKTRKMKSKERMKRDGYRRTKEIRPLSEINRVFC